MLSWLYWVVSLVLAFHKNCNTVSNLSIRMNFDTILLWYVKYITLLLFLRILKEFTFCRCLANLEVLLKFSKNSTRVTKQHKENPTSWSTVAYKVLLIKQTECTPSIITWKIQIILEPILNLWNDRCSRLIAKNLVLHWWIRLSIWYFSLFSAFKLDRIW